MKSVLVVGLGNDLMADEGIGPAVVRRVAERVPAGAEVVDAGTRLMAALHAMAGRRKVVFVDCAFMGQAPGTLRRFGPDEVQTRKVATGPSLHEGDLLTVLRLSKELGECPPEVVIFGIEPERVGPGMELSPALARRLGEYVRNVEAELERETGAQTEG
jgi:hydrogenase maturation protease